MKIINTLTKRHLLKNKKRTLVTLIAVILTSTLLFSIGFAYSTYRASEINNLKQTGNDYEAKIKDIPFSKRKFLDENKSIKHYEYISKVYDTDYLTSQSISGNEYLEVYTITDGIKFNLNGRLPQNDSEIIISPLIDSKIGSTLELNVIDYDGNRYKKEYKIVGIITSFSIDMRGKAYTKDNKINENANTYFKIYLKTRKNAYEQLFNVAKELGLEETYGIEGISYKNMDFNTTILELSGNYRDFVKKAIIYVSLMIILAVISIASAIIIYNSFSISLSDRKKQIGILKSVGMTKRQIRKLIFKEVFYISIIAIPLGFIISYLFVLGIVNYINFIQNGARTFILKIDISYLLMCLIFIILTIIYSAFFPAMRASEITPIEAIRQTKDIKIKKNRKTIFSKLFGIYGFMASSNMKRNKHKYKTAIIGSVISMVLFMTVATFINFLGSNSSSYYDVVTLYSGEINLQEAKEDIKEITNSNIVTDYLIMENKYAKLYGDFKSYYTDKYKKQYTVEQIPFFMGHFITANDNFYDKIKSKYKINNDNPIYINYLDNTNVFKKDSVIDFKMCDDYCETYTFNLINEVPKELKKFDLDNLIIVNEDAFNNIKDQSSGVSIFILSSDNMKLDKQIKDFLKGTNYVYSYTNNATEYIQEINDMKCMKIVLYTLIILFAFISITSIINTISASMYLRKREFAILKSVGLDDRGFNKILILESLLLSVKTIIYGTIFSSIVIYLIRNTFNLGEEEYTLAQIFPINYYIITIIVVFVSITLTIFTQLGKLKKDNIISNIKNENI